MPEIFFFDTLKQGKETNAQEKKGKTCQLFSILKLTHYFNVYFMKEMKTKLRIWMTKDWTRMKCNLHEVREVMMMLANQEVRKSRYINAVIINGQALLDAEIFKKPAGLGLGTPKVCFWYIQADDESNDDNKSIAESSSEEEMEVGETSQIGN